MKHLATALAAATITTTSIAPASAQDTAGQQNVRLVDSMALSELRGFLEAADYRILATVEETKTLRVQGGEDPAFYVELEGCGPDDRCSAIMILNPDGELAGLPDDILVDANRGFSGIKIVTYGPEKAVFYRRYVRLEGGVTTSHLLRQLVTFEVQYRNVAKHLRERTGGG